MLARAMVLHFVYQHICGTRARCESCRQARRFQTHAQHEGEAANLLEFDSAPGQSNAPSFTQAFVYVKHPHVAGGTQNRSRNRAGPHW
jgi:hypothetical protein